MSWPGFFLVLPSLLATLQAVKLPEWPPDASVADGDAFDFIVVGAGAAGSIVAVNLAQNPDWKVLLIEAGGDPPINSVLPGLQPTLIGSQYDWNYLSIDNGIAGRAQRSPGVFLVTKGKMLGGTSSINSMAYIRGNPADFDEWARVVNSNIWEWQNILPYILKSEGLQTHLLWKNNIFNPYHNFTGPIKVSTPLNRDPEVNHKIDILFKSMDEIGIPFNPDINGPTQQGLTWSMFTHTKPPGVRSSTAISYLVPNRYIKNLHVLKNSYVTKVLIDDDTAYGVEVSVADENIRVYARKEVIVSAGTISSPKVLIASGVGPKKEVAKLGIEQIVDLPVGQYLQNHFYVPIFLTGAQSFKTHFHKPWTPELDTLPYSQLTGFFSLQGNKIPDIQMACYYANQSSPIGQSIIKGYNYNDNVLDSILRALDEHEFFIIDLVLLRPKSTGSVTIRSVDKDVDPLINEGYFEEQEDVVLVRKAIRKILLLLGTEYFELVSSSMVKPDLPKCNQFNFFSDDYLDCYIVSMVTAQYHEVGTNGLGRVVDKDLKVYGLNNLRVADASIIPVTTHGNTYTPTMMVGEVASALIERDHISFSGSSHGHNRS